GQGADAPLVAVRLPRPSGPQGRLPAAVDHADQRGCTRQRDDVQPAHPGPAPGRGGGRPQDPGRPGRQRRGGVRPTRRHRPAGGGRRGQRRGGAGGRSSGLALGAVTSRQRPGDAPFTRRNPRVAAASRLRRRRNRDAAGRFLAEGPQAVREALRRPGTVRELFTTPESAHRHPELVDAARQAGVPVRTVTEQAAAALSETVTPQGLVAVCDRVDVPLAAALSPPPRLAAVLVEIRDPGNAGTVLRTADAAGAGLVVFAGDAVDPYNGKCVRATAGSLFHVPVVRAA